MPEPATAALTRRDLSFSTAWADFHPDGREYVITTRPEQLTPVPWVNVLANPAFGTVISGKRFGLHLGGECPRVPADALAQRPGGDSSGEAFICATRKAAASGRRRPARRGAAPYVCRHGFGYSIFEYADSWHRSELTVYVAADAPVKFCVLKVRNVSGRPRRLSVTGYVEWVLGNCGQNLYARGDGDRPQMRRPVRPQSVQHRVCRTRGFFDV